MNRAGDSKMTIQFSNVNGTKIAYRVQGEGPPLVLIMGYRLSSAAWPAAFVASLARRFTVITLDNRGTGMSDKPLEGYAIANMARDIAGLLNELGIERTNLLGYSMGGAIAQEFVRQFPERVSKLILCATMCGGTRATYAKPEVTRVMRDLDGVTPEQIARRIWKVTYAPGYLAQHETLAEDQMRREIALPTPLHAADLQFQAFAEFDGSKALKEIQCPTLVVTGDLDELVPPQNSVLMARLIPGAQLVIIDGGGHRVLWEATEQCLTLIADFLTGAIDPAVSVSPDAFALEHKERSHDTLSSAITLMTIWPSTLIKSCFEAMTVVQQSLMWGASSHYGDGKPIILVPRYLDSDLSLIPQSGWLKAFGYRPVTAGFLVSLNDSAGDRSLSKAIRDATRRLGRKGVLVTHSSGMTRAMRAATAHKDLISDVVVFEATHKPAVDGVRVHLISSRWSILHGMIELRRVLRGIGIELIDSTGDRSLSPKTAMAVEHN